MILNLKDLNENVVYHHFKMDTFESALKLVRPNCYMASIDLKNAYYSVPIAKEHRKCLRFLWKDKIFQYTCLPNGIACAPRIFTKLLKPVYATLHQLGYINMGYIDDSILIGDDYEECSENIKVTKDLVESVGFTVNDKKSVFIPVQKLHFLGFFINSVNMQVTLPQEKVENIKHLCFSLSKKDETSIKEVAKVIGTLVSVFPAVEYGKLFYRNLELQKIHALKKSFGDYNGQLQITTSMKNELHWWINNIQNQYRIIDHGSPDLIITTDASSEGWGSVCNDMKIGGRWSDFERDFHINYLELLAVFYALKSFCKEVNSKYIAFKVDNTCAISYINNMGGIKSADSNILAKSIWIWCIEHNIWISADYIPSAQNIADIESRKFNDNIEWMLSKDIFKALTKIWGMPCIDLFATRLNRQIARFAAWKPDPDCDFVNAFSVCWSDIYIYVFPPFSLIGRCVQKIRREQAECMMIIPVWPTQSWYSSALQLLVEQPILLPSTHNLLTLPGTDKVHPLINSLKLMACRLSGSTTKVRTFLLEQPELSCLRGEQVQRNNIRHLLKSGSHFVVKDRLIHFKYL